MVLLVRACTTPQPEKQTRILPKRIQRARRVMESKRLDSFREVHEALKKTAKEETDFVKDFFTKTRDMFNEEKDDDTE